MKLQHEEGYPTCTFRICLFQTQTITYHILKFSARLNIIFRDFFLLFFFIKHAHVHPCFIVQWRLVGSVNLCQFVIVSLDRPGNFGGNILAVKRNNSFLMHKLCGILLTKLRLDENILNSLNQLQEYHRAVLYTVQE